MHHLTKVKCQKVLVEYGMKEINALQAINIMLNLGYIKTGEEE